MELKIIILTENENLSDEEIKNLVPVYATEGSVGLDLYARNLKALYNGTKSIILDKIQKNLKEGYFFIGAGERALIGTGFAVEIPEGYEAQIRSKSGIALKRGLMVANGIGTIDQDFRGEVCVIIYNPTNFPQRISFDEQIAQMVICPVTKIKSIRVEKMLSETDRGDGGFGSTNNNKE